MNLDLKEIFQGFLPCSRKLPFGVRGQLQLRDVGEHRSVAGRQAGDPDQRGVGVHGGVGIQGHLLGCKKQTVIVSEKDEMMFETSRQREEREPNVTFDPTATSPRSILWSALIIIKKNINFILKTLTAAVFKNLNSCPVIARSLNCKKSDWF